ncbi:PaaI family thioesterase [Phenylobacterium kunshanense]|uniref:PaaI family thioesterase n=1 Tax=Phenylobacterium kunshanense TaxID=1445034 RepID=A0A328BA27_9CAUL|nr:PaaI family thioesterase [Phenylobacterium kunshanense]RAK63649.1 PaaI family thioesterase [Phenylobacterium kunshanense]
MDGGDPEASYVSKLTTVTEGEWAGWSYYPGGDPYEDLAGPFYFRMGEDGRPVCAFKAEQKHMNGGGFMHGGCVMTFADFCLFVIAREELKDQHAVTATFNGEFVGTARPGDMVTCTGEVVKGGRSMVFVRGLIAGPSGTMMSFSAVLKKTGPRTS